MTVTAPAATASRLETCSVDDPRWLDFVARRPEATVFHHPAWAHVLMAAYGYRTQVLVLAEDGQIVAGLPMVERARANGRHLIGLPFTDYCPPLTRSPADLAALSSGLVSWQRGTPLSRLTIHAPLPGAGTDVVTRAVRHILPLPDRSADVLRPIRGGQVDRAIRKARREGLAVRISRSRADVDHFYRLHLQTRRRLGVPVQPKRFLQCLWELVIAQDLGFVVFAGPETQPVAAALFLAWNQTLIYKFGASDPGYWRLRPNHLVIWTAIEWGCAHGFTQLDLGRSDLGNRGLRDFKDHWGATELPLAYSYLPSAPPMTPPVAMRALAWVIQSSPPVVCQAIGELFYRHAAGVAA